MKPAIDLLKFEQSTGNLKWLSVVAAAFLRQLPQWRVEFAAALDEQNLGLQVDLLHKIKGACYAVAAYNTIEAITKAEAAHALGQPPAPARLLRRLEEVEAELQAIVGKPAAQ